MHRLIGAMVPTPGNSPPICRDRRGSPPRHPALPDFARTLRRSGRRPGGHPGLHCADDRPRLRRHPEREYLRPLLELGTLRSLAVFEDGPDRLDSSSGGGAGLAYLTRPEGLLLPAALGATLALWPFWVARVRQTRIDRHGGFSRRLGGGGGAVCRLERWTRNEAQYSRLLGTAPHSAPEAVERLKPLDPHQSRAKTLILAACGRQGNRGRGDVSLIGDGGRWIVRVRPPSGSRSAVDVVGGHLGGIVACAVALAHDRWILQARHALVLALIASCRQ